MSVREGSSEEVIFEQRTTDKEGADKGPTANAHQHIHFTQERKKGEERQSRLFTYLGGGGGLFPETMPVTFC